MLCGALAAGLLLGGGAAKGWYQADALKSRAELAAVKAEGDRLGKEYARQRAVDKAEKEKADADYQASIGIMRADAERLRNARASRRTVPAAPAGSVRPDLACFDRAELERALKRLDAGLSGLVAEGDEGAVSLNVARRWAAGIRRENPQNNQP